jgi:hypothetical protein
MSPQEQPEQIDRNYVRLLMVMRRFVREEFNTRIAISEPEGAVQLLAYATRSSNTVLQEMGKELREMLAPGAPDDVAPREAVAEAKVKVHYYRGVASTHAAAAPSGASAVTSGRIYRGRVVAG